MCGVCMLCAVVDMCSVCMWCAVYLCGMACACLVLGLTETIFCYGSSQGSTTSNLLAASSLSNLHSNSLVSQVCTSGPCSETHLVYMGKDEYHAYRVVLDPGMLCKPSLLMSWQCGPILSSISPS